MTDFSVDAKGHKKEHAVIFNRKITVTELMAFSPEYPKKKSVFVPGRPYHSLTFRVTGEVTVDDGKGSLVSRTGDITFVPRGKSYTSEVKEGGEMHVLHFCTAEKYEDISCHVFSPTNPIIYRNMFSELASRYKPGRENDFSCLSLFYGILAEIHHEQKRREENFHPAAAGIRQAKRFIDRNFADTALSVSSLAQQAGISEVYFRREFGKSFGTSPVAYIKKVRIENAKALLRTGYYSVTETAMMCGFDSISYFSAEFRRAVGCTPREYAGKALLDD